jgi:hypothetical protein
MDVAAVKKYFNELKWLLIITSISSSIGISAASTFEEMPNPEDLPAVANMNGWIGATAGYLNHENGSGFGVTSEAGLAAGITRSIAAQLKIDGGTAAHSAIFSSDGYLFWRHPTLAMFGAHVTYLAGDHNYQTLYGLHVEGFLDNWTLVGEGGGMHHNDHDSTGYGQAMLHWYALPNLDFTVGAIGVDDNGAGQLGIEYQLGLISLPVISVFANAGQGSRELSYVELGLRFYFGDVCNPTKPLIQRHREDMVPSIQNLLIYNPHT